MIQDAIGRLAVGSSLTEGEASGCMRDIVEGRATQAQMGAFLVALRAKGEAPEEIAAFASTLREYSVRIRPQIKGRLVDTCGTGGDSSGTFNVSTVSAMVAAGAGAVVAKHGNRSVTSACGSADLMERLGFDLAAAPPSVKESIETNGIGFMFAPTFHPAMKVVASTRREIGIRTVFNILGPLLNPAGAECQVLGVYSESIAPKMAEALRRLGTREALVVCSSDGTDEISAAGKTTVHAVKDGAISVDEYTPADFGFEADGEGLPRVKSADEAAEVAVRVLSGRGKPDVVLKTVVANASAALKLAGVSGTLADGARKARKSIENGDAMKKLVELVKSSGGDPSRIEKIAQKV